MDLGLDGRAAIVTGGSRGIGFATARALADEGMSVGLLARDPDRLAEAAAKLRDLGAHVVFASADLDDEDQTASAIARVAETFGRLDVLVNNAATVGGTAVGRLLDADAARLRADFDGKYIRYLRCARLCAPRMARGGWGRIVNIGGISARAAGHTTSGFRNLALSQLTKTLAIELGADGIGVTLLHPGTIHTGDWVERKAAISGRTVEQVEKDIADNAIRRGLAAAEIARLVTWLASEPALALTGGVIEASGGADRAIRA